MHCLEVGGRELLVRTCDLPSVTGLFCNCCYYKYHVLLFQVHRLCMVLTLVLTLVGIVAIFVDVEDFTDVSQQHVAPSIFANLECVTGGI